jgi:hypothetical protein
LSNPVNPVKEIVFALISNLKSENKGENQRNTLFSSSFITVIMRITKTSVQTGFISLYSPSGFWLLAALRTLDYKYDDENPLSRAGSAAHPPRPLSGATRHLAASRDLRLPPQGARKTRGPKFFFSCPHRGKRFHRSREAARCPKGTGSPLVQPYEWGEL